jgi:hypothetical protein
MFCSEAVAEAALALGALRPKVNFPLYSSLTDKVKPAVVLPPDILRNRVHGNGWSLDKPLLFVKNQ